MTRKTTITALVLLGAMSAVGCAVAGEVNVSSGERFGRPVRILDNGLIRLAVTPQIGGRVLELSNLATGNNVAKVSEVYIHKSPDDEWQGAEYGGFTDAATSGWPGPFWGVTYDLEVVEADDGAKAIVVTGKASGLRVQRTMTVHPDSTLLTVKTVQENISDKPRVSNIRLHCEMIAGTRGDNAERVFYASPEGVQHKKHTVGMEVTRFWWLDVAGGWFSLVDSVEAEGILRRLYPADAEHRVFYWLSYHEHPRQLGEEGAFLGLDWFGEEQQLKPGESMSATEEMFLFSGLKRTDFAHDHLAGALSFDKDRYGSTDTVQATVSLAGAQAIDGFEATVQAYDKDRMLAEASATGGKARAGQASSASVELPLKDLADGTYIVQARVRDRQGNLIGQAKREITVIGQLVRRVRSAQQAFAEKLASLRRRAESGDDLAVRTELDVLELRRRELAELMGAGRYEKFLQLHRRADFEADRLAEMLSAE
jgi:hypothetical protein